MTDHEIEALEAEVVREDEAPDTTGANTIVAAADILPNTLYLLPLSERPFFPAQALPLLLNEERGCQLSKQRPIVISVSSA